MLSGTPNETLRYGYTLRFRHPDYTVLRQLVLSSGLYRPTDQLEVWLILPVLWEAESGLVQNEEKVFFVASLEP